MCCGRNPTSKTAAIIPSEKASEAGVRPWRVPGTAGSRKATRTVLISPQTR